MSSWLKTLVVLALVVPMTAYVAGSLVSSRSYDPSDRTPVIIQDVPASERTSDRDRRSDRASGRQGGQGGQGDRPGPGGQGGQDGQDDAGSGTPTPSSPATTTPTRAPTPAPTGSPTRRGTGPQQPQSPTREVEDNDATVVTPQPTPVDDDDDDDDDDGPEEDDDDDEADDDGDDD